MLSLPPREKGRKERETLQQMAEVTREGFRLKKILIEDWKKAREEKQVRGLVGLTQDNLKAGGLAGVYVCSRPGVFWGQLLSVCALDPGVYLVFSRCLGWYQVGGSQSRHGPRPWVQTTVGSEEGHLSSRFQGALICKLSRVGAGEVSGEGRRG